MTTTAKAASEGVQFLKSIQGGRVTFLPMDSVKGRPYDTPALSEDGVIGTAVDCIEFDAAYNHIFQYLLGRTLVVETMERAIALQKKYNQQLRIVTLTGGTIPTRWFLNWWCNEEKTQFLVKSS